MLKYDYYDEWLHFGELYILDDEWWLFIVLCKKKKFFLQ